MEFRLPLDVNYRSLLWSPQNAREVLEPLARKSDIVFCSRRDAQIVFNSPYEGAETCSGMRELLGVRTVVSTDQIDGVYISDSELGDHIFPVTQVPVIDRPGAGDAFVAGTIHGFLEGDVMKGISYGQRTSSYALTHYGDLTHVASAELDIPTTTDIMR